MLLPSSHISCTYIPCAFPHFLVFCTLLLPHLFSISFLFLRLKNHLIFYCSKNTEHDIYLLNKIFRVQHSIVNHRSNAVRQILEVIQLAKLRLYIG